jgi:hypothetical protein
MESERVIVNLSASLSVNSPLRRLKNPDYARLAGAALTLWILRSAQNDAYCFD